MKLREAATAITVIFVVCVLAIGYVSHLIVGKDDAPVEEAMEAIAEQQLGLPPGTIDITPGSPEGDE